jgi:LysM repeat protein
MPIAEQKQSYDQELTAKGVSGVQNYGATELFNTPAVNGQPAWTQSSGRHVVQSGETALSIAQTYGYTEERFRFFNNLGPTERVREGDILQVTDCLPGSTATNSTATTDMQTKGVSNYSSIPQNSNYSTPLNQAFEYTNESNPVYIDEYNDFDQNYPDEFQQKAVEEYNSTGSPQNYNFPPGSVPKSPESVVPTGEPTDNFYSPSNYGPIPGTYNNNRPLKEPQNYNYPPSTNDPTNYNNYIQPQSNQGAVPPNTSKSGANTSLLYGGAPTNYSNTGGTMVKGLPSGEYPNDQLILTGVKKMHIVKEGETLSSIAARYGTTVRRLRSLNQMEKNEIVIPFQEIYVQK